MTLDELNVNEMALVKKISNYSNLKQRLTDIGIIEGTKIECVIESPSKNPKAFMIKGAVIAIRNEDAKFIEVERSNYEKWK